MPILKVVSMDVALLPVVVFFVLKKSQIMSEVRKLTLAITYTIDAAQISFLPLVISSLRLRLNLSHSLKEQAASSPLRYCLQKDLTSSEIFLAFSFPQISKGPSQERQG